MFLKVRLKCFSQENASSIWATPSSNWISLFNLHTHSCPTLQLACAALSQITIILTRLSEKSTHLRRGSAGRHSLRRLMASWAFDSNKQSIQYKVLERYATVWLCQHAFFFSLSVMLHSTGMSFLIWTTAWSQCWIIQLWILLICPSFFQLWKRAKVILWNFKRSLLA